MNILFIHNAYQQRGGEDVALELETALLEQKGHQVKTLVFRNPAFSGPAEKVKGLVQAFYNTDSARQVEEAVATFRPDVAHVHNLFFVASPSVLFALHRLRIPVVATLHNYRLICANALLLRDGKICERCVHQSFPLAGIRYKCYRSSALESALVTGITGVNKLLGTWKDKVHTYIALTGFGRQKILDSSLGLPPGQVTVVPNFVPDGGAGAFPRSDFFLFVGRISPEKGVDALLECFSSLPGLRLVLAGDGPELERLQQQYGSCANISFQGRCSPAQVAALLKQCRALVFPSVWYEGLPFTIIEAFSAGTPVIASRLGAMAEIVRDGYNGFHFTAGDVADMKAVLLRFAAEAADNPGWYRQARHTYEEHYHPDSHYRSLMAVYHQAMEKTAT
ncbi:glycosyltransferase family 4 protein [Paraflavisolibacter sp. H34]|uniref:glycosyltransferase family 4 protein n=1 Tax=Huijunlia imazamoxiresistens TaxID=3127457 RepID=UPI00301937F1